MRTKNEVKAVLAKEVAHKVALTAARRAIKRIPYADRAPESHLEMLELGRQASIQKDDVRATQLAYALVRDKPYWTQERRVRQRSGVPPIKGYASRIGEVAGVSDDEVIAWLEAPVAEEDRAAFEAHLAAAKAAIVHRPRQYPATRRSSGLPHPYDRDGAPLTEVDLEAIAMADRWLDGAAE